MNRREEIKARIAELRQQLQQLDGERRKAISAAQTKVFADFAPRIDPIAKEIEELNLEDWRIRRDAAEREARENPLAGRKVSAYRKRPGASWYSKPELVYGIVEVVVPGTEQGNKRGYRRLSMGDVAVRLLNAKGNPLKTIEPLGDLRDSEEAKAASLKYEEGEKRGAHLRHYWQLID